MPRREKYGKHFLFYLGTIVLTTGPTSCAEAMSSCPDRKRKITAGMNLWAMINMFVHVVWVLIGQVKMKHFSR